MAEIEPKLRVMVDANVLVAGTGWPRFPYEVLQHAIAGDYRLVLSPFVLAEAQEHISRLFPQRLELFDQLLIATKFEAVPTPTQAELAVAPQLTRDPDDMPIVLAAIEARVNYFISQDRDITDPDEPLHKYLRVLLPAAFLRHLMGWSSEDLERIRNRNWRDLE